jgi:hypothetical protein
MKNKLLIFTLIVTLFVAGITFGNVQTTEAQTVTFPSGCSSALGYSVTNGSPCTGSSTVIPRFMSGCTTALGYSITNGLPCSGSSVALQWLAGCTSLVGYSTIDSAPCNGTSVATAESTTPGFPTTGAGGNAPLNIILLLSSAIIAIMGSAYLIHNYKKSI